MRSSSVKKAKPVNQNNKGRKILWLRNLTVKLQELRDIKEFVQKFPEPLNARVFAYSVLQKHIYAQVIDDVNGVTLASASTMDKDFGAYGGNKEAAAKVGKAVAERALAKNIETVVFDRGGFIYTGRVKELADGAREGGLKF